MLDNIENQDWESKEDPIFNKFCKLTTGIFNQVLKTDFKGNAAKIDWKAAKAKVDWNTALKTNRTPKINYKELGEKRLGKPLHSKEHIKKMYKPVLQFDLQNNFIKEWDSAKEAAIAMGRPKSDDIGAVCRGKQKTAYGFIWKFKLEQN